MRGKKTVINTIMSLIQEFVGVVCGFILPRLILSAFGSKYNGLTTSISQFLACAVLLRSGIGGATRAALYKPIARNDRAEISSIVKATDIFMKKIGLILAGAIVAFAAIYPFLVQNEFDWFFTFTLFLIIGASTFAESFFGVTYLIVLQADQRLWVSSLMRSVCTILNTIFASLLILHGSSIHVVKLATATVYVAYPIVLGFYVRRKYQIDRNAKPDNQAISQRWDAFWQQVAVFVMNNTDVMVLTAFTNLLEVSVYGVYNMIVSGIRSIIVAFSNGLEAAFGNMIAKEERALLKENVAIIELIVYGMSTIAYTCTALLVFDFIRIYTKVVTDVDYIRPAFAYMIIIANFFNNIRIPYQTVVNAAGHFKQTKKGAILEPILNISLSILFVIKFGIVGVAIGTLAATVFRTIQYSVYMSKNIVIRSMSMTIHRCLTSFVESAIVILIVHFIKLDAATDYITWILNAIITGIISSIVVLTGSLIFYRQDVIRLLTKVRAIVKKRK